MAPDQPVNPAWYQEPPTWGELVDEHGMPSLGNLPEDSYPEPEYLAAPMMPQEPYQPKQKPAKAQRGLLIGLIAALVAGGAGAWYLNGQAQNWEAEANSWERSAIHAEGRIAELEHELTSLGHDHELAVTGANAAATEKSRAQGELDLANHEIAELNAAKDVLAEELEELEAELAEQKLETAKAEDDLEELKTTTHDRLDRIVTAFDTCVFELGRFEDMLRFPESFNPAQTDAWIREHRALCDGAVQAGKTLLGTLS